MNENNRLTNIENKLENIQKTLNTLAVQSEQISSIQTQVSVLWKKYDILIDPKDGVIPKLQTFQAGCPKETFQGHIKWIWGVLIPLMLTQICIAVRILTE